MRLATVTAWLVLASLPAQAKTASDAERGLDAPVCPEWAVPSHSFCQWQLRADVREWIALLAPLHATLTGTKGADVLGAGDAGDVVRGLAGDDSLTSHFNRTALLGNRGADTLVTETSAVGTDARGLAIQIGGSGDDWHSASLGVDPLGPDSNGELLIDLGRGDDVVDADVHLNGYGPLDDFDTTRVSAQIFGRGGDDVIHSVADAENNYGDGLAINVVDGGAGDDHITVSAVTEFDGSETIADNRVSGGDGDDVVDATAINWPNQPISASNTLLGGRGNDALRAFCLTDSNSLTSVGTNELWGGEGDDQLEAVHSTDGENWITDLTTVLQGEGGDDQLRASSGAYGENVVAVHRLDGGRGDDALTALFRVAVFDGYYDNETTNVLDGGPGRDRLEASVTASFPGSCRLPSCGVPPLAENHLSGGNGSDELIATLGPDVVGASFLSGGNGRDRLTVVGGSGNVLDGGRGRDDLFAGSGDDRLIGGRGPDTFHFDLTQDQGTDTIVDLEARHDSLSFAGLDDEGSPGLADDLDAISTVADLGPGGDVVVDLAVGTRIVFAGRGTGGISSWVALVPPRALRQGGPAEMLAEARAAPATSLPAAAAALAGWPRDHSAAGSPATR